MFERLAAGIERVSKIGASRRSLAQLERMHHAARRARSEADLRAVVAVANELGDALEGHDRSKALLVAFNAKQALAELGRARPPATTGPATRPHPDSEDMEPVDLAAELKELAALHAAGALTDEEFRLAKLRLLG